MFPNLSADIARLTPDGRPGFSKVVGALLFDNGFQAVLFYRLARWFKARRIPFFGPMCSRLGTFVTGAEISPSAEIGPGLRISHGVGLVVGGYAKIGSNALLLHGVTLGSPAEARVEEMPVVGDRVFLGAGATLIGRIVVGDDVVVGANAVVTRNVPTGSRVRVAAAVIAQEVPADSGM